MTEHNEFFEQLRRGEQRPSNTLYSQLHRIPPEPKGGVVQIKHLLTHAVDEVYELVQTIGNIIRWHGPDQILPELREEQLELLRKLREIAPDSVPED